MADPVCTATGHFLEVEDDFTFPERLDVLRWRRTYSSRFVAGGPFGRGWASWASAGLVPEDDGAVGYQGPDGQLVVFVPSLAVDDPAGAYAPVPGIAARLVRRWGLTVTCPWRLVRGDDLVLSWSTPDAADTVWDLIGCVSSAPARAAATHRSTCPTARPSRRSATPTSTRGWSGCRGPPTWGRCLTAEMRHGPVG